MSITLNRSSSGISYALVEGYPKFKFSDDSASATEEIILHKSNLSAWHAISLPPPVVFGDSVEIPARRPMPGTIALVTKSLAFEPFLPDKSQDIFEIFDEDVTNDYIRCTIEYETNEKNQEEQGNNDPSDPETFLEFKFDATADLLKLPPTKVHFGDDNVEQNQLVEAADVNVDNEIPLTKVVPTTTYSVNWKLALNPDFELFRSLLGHVNGMDEELFFNAPDETILFTGFSGKQSYLWNGEGNTTVTPWDLTFEFIGKHVEDGGNVIGGNVAGWQHVYRPSTGNWERVKRKDGSRLYRETTTWESMFRSGGLL